MNSFGGVGSTTYGPTLPTGGFTFLGLVAVLIVGYVMAGSDSLGRGTLLLIAALIFAMLLIHYRAAIRLFVRGG